MCFFFWGGGGNEETWSLFNPVFPNLRPHDQNGSCQISGGPQKSYHFYWATGLIYGPQLIEWSIELLLTTSGPQKNSGFKVGHELKKVGNHWFNPCMAGGGYMSHQDSGRSGGWDIYVPVSIFQVTSKRSPVSL